MSSSISRVRHLLEIAVVEVYHGQDSGKDATDVFFLSNWSNSLSKTWQVIFSIIAERRAELVVRLGCWDRDALVLSLVAGNRPQSLSAKPRQGCKKTVLTDLFGWDYRPCRTHTAERHTSAAVCTPKKVTRRYNESIRRSQARIAWQCAADITAPLKYTIQTLGRSVGSRPLYLHNSGW